MLSTANPARRLAGRLLILTATAVALPLTASQAIEYVDTPAPAVPAAAPAQPDAAPLLAVAALQPAAPVAPTPPAAPARPLRVDHNLSIDGDWITIDGQRKRWEQLTPAEKTKVESAVAEARAAMAKVHIDRTKIMSDVASVRRIDVEKLQREVARAQAGAADAMRSVEANSAVLRASGEDPERIKESVREAMESARRVDMNEVRRAISEVDEAKMAKTLAEAEQSMAKARADLDRIDARIRADGKH